MLSVHEVTTAYQGLVAISAYALWRRWLRPRRLADPFAEGRVLVAVLVAHDEALVAAARLEGAHVGDRHHGFH